VSARIDGANAYIRPHLPPEEVTRRRDRAVACVNACAGPEIPPDARLGCLRQVVDAVRPSVVLEMAGEPQDRAVAAEWSAIVFSVKYRVRMPMADSKDEIQYTVDIEGATWVRLGACTSLETARQLILGNALSWGAR
jgi:hypothetical protein